MYGLCVIATVRPSTTSEAIWDFSVVQFGHMSMGDGAWLTTIVQNSDEILVRTLKIHLNIHHFKCQILNSNPDS